uniref:Uncharacterized protein n=1 Tax=Romanomermis culicivorax TaxID=13658 RepID=A0A915I289_ROMCU
MVTRFSGDGDDDTTFKLLRTPDDETAAAAFSKMSRAPVSADPVDDALAVRVAKVCENSLQQTADEPAAVKVKVAAAEDDASTNESGAQQKANGSWKV